MSTIFNLRESLDRISECDCQDAEVVSIETDEPQASSQEVEQPSNVTTYMSINYTLRDGTNVSKSFDDQEDFLNILSIVRSNPDIVAYTISHSESKTEQSVDQSTAAPVVSVG